MRAEPEGHVLVGLAGDVEALGVVEVGLVEVGAFVEEHDLVASVQLAAVERRVLGECAAHVLDRRHPPQHLLDGDGHRREVIGKALVLAGIEQQLLHASADDVAGRLVAAHKDE